MLKIRSGYSLRSILDTYIVIGSGSDSYIPNCLISVNKTGALLWDAAAAGTEREKLVELLLERYDVDRETAGEDVDKFLSQLREKNIIEEL